MNKINFKILMITILSGVVLACGSGGKSTPSSLTNAGINNVNLTESNLTLTPDLNKPTIKIEVISSAEKIESVYETGESFTIKASLTNPTSVDVKNKIKLVTSNTGLIYESDECTINNNESCIINVKVAESANLGESSLSIISDTKLIGTTELKFNIVAGNIIFFTRNDLREVTFAKHHAENESAVDVANKWCNDYANSTKYLPELPDRYRHRFYKGMILGNPATIKDKVYYRPDAKTKVATATSEYLAESLESTVMDTYVPNFGTMEFGVWTGADGNSCQNWTGGIWYHSGTQGIVRNKILNQQWWFDTFAPKCNSQTSGGVYCVSQANDYAK